MKTIFERGYFHSYRVEEVYFSQVENRTNLLLENKVYSYKTKVFLSHKHSDLQELKDFIGFLERNYNVDVYIDSMDKSMPFVYYDGSEKYSSGDPVKAGFYYGYFNENSKRIIMPLSDWLN